MPANDERKLYPITKRVVDEKKKLTSFYRAANKIRGIADLGTGSVDDLVDVVADFLANLCVERMHKGELWSAVCRPVRASHHSAEGQPIRSTAASASVPWP